MAAQSAGAGPSAAGAADEHADRDKSVASHVTEMDAGWTSPGSLMGEDGSDDGVLDELIFLSSEGAPWRVPFTPPASATARHHATPTPPPPTKTRTRQAAFESIRYENDGKENFICELSKESPRHSRLHRLLLPRVLS